MSVRHFAGTDRIVLAPGGVRSMNLGMVTIAALAKVTQDNVDARCILSGQAAATNSRRAFYLSSTGFLTLQTGGFAAASPVQVLAAHGWCLLAVTKGLGSVAPRFHRYRYDLDEWVHADGDVSFDDGGIVDHLSVGQMSQDFGWRGRIALIGVWLGMLSDSTLEELTDSIDAWTAAGPDALPPFNQGSVDDPVLDLVGDSDQTDRVGTSVTSGDDPPFNFNPETPPEPAPADQTYVVPPESRTYAVAAEDRTHPVPAESRTYQVPAEDRTVQHS